MPKEPLPISIRSLYAKTYAKHGQTGRQSKDAENKAYEAVEKKHGKEMRDKLNAFHNENEASAERGENYPMKRGGKIDLDDCKITTGEHKNPKHKGF
jgi:hypothetical protein